MANFLTKNKKVIIFVISFLVVVLSDVVIFSGLFSQIFANQFSWILDNTILSLLIYFWMFMGMPLLIAYFAAFVVFKDKRKIIDESVVANNETGQVTEKKLEDKQVKIAIFVTVVLGVLVTVLIRWGTQPRFLPYTFQDVQPGELSTPDPTANWQTYTNKKYLFQLQYPLSYSETLNPEENDIWFDFPGPPYPPEIVININVNPSKPNDTLSGYVEESSSYFRTQKLSEQNDFKITKTNEMQLGGERAIKLNYQKSGLEGETIYTIHANYRYSINRFSVNSAGGKLIRNEEFDQILSTFSFSN